MIIKLHYIIVFIFYRIMQYWSGLKKEYNYGEKKYCSTQYYFHFDSEKRKKS